MKSLGILGTLAVMLVVSGCGTTRVVQKPSEAVIRDVKEGKAAIVLLQIRSTIDGKFDPAAAGHHNIRLYIANVDKRQSPKRLITLKAPSEASAADGWFYLALAPGTYYLLILPPGMEQNPPATVFHATSARYGRLTQYRFQPGRGGYWSPNLSGFILPGARPADFREIPGYWFVIPPKRPVIYLGSIAVNCCTGKGLFGDLIDTCSDFSLSRVSDEAARVAGSAFPNNGSIHESVLVPLGRPAKLARPLLDMPIALSVVPPGSFMPAEFAAPPATLTGLMIHGVNQEIAVYNLLALAVGGISQSIARSEARRRSLEVQPCVEKLSKQLQALDTAGLFSRAIASALQSGGVRLQDKVQERPVPPATSTLPYSLVAATERVLLRECENTTGLCLELGMRLRVCEPTSGDVVYESILLYSSDFLPLEPSQHGPHIYECLVERKSPCVPLDSWCGDAGAATLQERLKAGATAIAAQFIRDISLP